jgi:hypothetical protein
MWHTKEGAVTDSGIAGRSGVTSAARLAVLAFALNIGAANAFGVCTRRKGGMAGTTSEEARSARAAVTICILREQSALYFVACGSASSAFRDGAPVQVRRFFSTDGLFCFSHADICALTSAP